MAAETKTSLKKKSKEDLVVLAEERGLSTDGNKDELIDRILAGPADADVTLEDDTPPVPAENPAHNGDGSEREQDPKKQRVEEYERETPDGGTVTVVHNIDTGEITVKD